jgi:hypothetical protein
VSSAISRDAVAGWSLARRATSETDSTVSSGVNASKMRTARDSTDSRCSRIVSMPSLPGSIRSQESQCSSVTPGRIWKTGTS